MYWTRFDITQAINMSNGACIPNDKPHLHTIPTRRSYIHSRTEHLRTPANGFLYKPSLYSQGCLHSGLDSKHKGAHSAVTRAQPTEQNTVLRATAPESATECSLDIREADGDEDFAEVGRMRAIAYYEVKIFLNVLQLTLLPCLFLLSWDSTRGQTELSWNHKVSTLLIQCLQCSLIFSLMIASFLLSHTLPCTWWRASMQHPCTTSLEAVALIMAPTQPQDLPYFFLWATVIRCQCKSWDCIIRIDSIFRNKKPGTMMTNDVPVGVNQDLFRHIQQEDSNTISLDSSHNKKLDLWLSGHVRKGTRSTQRRCAMLSKPYRMSHRTRGWWAQ